MGVLPLQFGTDENAKTLGLDGTESYDIQGMDKGKASEVTIKATRTSGNPIVFRARVRIDTPRERDYYQHGGILHYVLRQLAKANQST